MNSKSYGGKREPVESVGKLSCTSRHHIIINLPKMDINHINKLTRDDVVSESNENVWCMLFIFKSPRAKLQCVMAKMSDPLGHV